MSQGLTEFQKRLLRFLREETARLNGSACYLDAFFERLSSSQTMRGKGFFLKELNNIENEGLIETTRSGYTRRKGMKFNCYRITEKGLEILRMIESFLRKVRFAAQMVFFSVRGSVWKAIGHADEAGLRILEIMENLCKHTVTS